MEEEDGELFKTEISFTGMPGKLLVSGKKKNGNVLLRGILGMFESSLRISSNAVRATGQLLNG